jgi:hypothetical protein
MIFSKQASATPRAKKRRKKTVTGTVTSTTHPTAINAEKTAVAP